MAKVRGWQHETYPTYLIDRSGRQMVVLCPCTKAWIWRRRWVVMERGLSVKRLLKSSAGWRIVPPEEAATW